jgi:hypothetical protein
MIWESEGSLKEKSTGESIENVHTLSSLSTKSGVE